MLPESVGCQSSASILSHPSALPVLCFCTVRIPHSSLVQPPCRKLRALRVPQKREDPVVSPRPGLLVCRKEGLFTASATRVPHATHELPRQLPSETLRQR